MSLLIYDIKNKNSFSKDAKIVETHKMIEQKSELEPNKYTFHYLIMHLFSSFMSFRDIKNSISDEDKIVLIQPNSLSSLLHHVNIFLALGAIDLYQYQVYMLWYNFFEDELKNVKYLSSSNFITGSSEYAQLCSIDGNIGAGKSTLIDYIKKHSTEYPNLLLVPEPVDTWEKITVEGVTMLKAYYSDIEKYSFVFQLMALFTRFISLIEAFKTAKDMYTSTGIKTTVVIERTILTDYNIFAKMLNESKMMSDHELKVYECWYQIFTVEFPITNCVYIRAKPETCLERCKSRKREGEDVIPLDYLKLCHDKHEMFYSKILREHNCKVVDNEHDMNSEEYSVKIKEIIQHLIE